MDEASRLLREKEAAELAALTGNTLRKYRQLMIGPAFIRISGRCIRYRREDVLRWLESRRVEPDSDSERHIRNVVRRNVGDRERDARYAK
jgi:predicted DNA-binding transcriptional regulator AlpA